MIANAHHNLCLEYFRAQPLPAYCLMRWDICFNMPPDFYIMGIRAACYTIVVYTGLN